MRVYLSLPECAPAGTLINITGGSVKVFNGDPTTGTPLGNGTLFSPTTATPIVPSYTGVTPKNDPGDPIFVIPGKIMTPCGGAPGCTVASFTATFKITLNYSLNGTIRNLVVNPAPTAQIGPKTNALRILVVPMGDAHQPYRSQFTPDGEAATRKAIQTLSRIWPVPANVGELCPASGNVTVGCSAAQAGGIRYHIDLAAMLDLSDTTVATPKINGLFCVGRANFDTLRAKLGQMLLVWNTHNPSNSADEVLGVADEAISVGAAEGCAEGMGALNGPQAWVRGVADKPNQRSMTGSVMAMELAHTLGMTPSPRGAAFHSLNTSADVGIPDRGYNVVTRSLLEHDKSTMLLDNSSTPWNDDVTLFEKEDQGFSLCDLGGLSTSECATPSKPLGTTQGVNAGPRIVISGRTTAALNAATPYNTSVFESYHTENVAETPNCPTCRYVLYENTPTGPIKRGFNVSFTMPGHLFSSVTHRFDNGALNWPPTASMGLFSFALADGVMPDSFDLYFCPQSDPGACIADPVTLGTKLYGSGVHTTQPNIQSAQVAGVGVPNDYAVKSDDFDEPVFSWDATTVAHDYYEPTSQIFDQVYAIGDLDGAQYLDSYDVRTGERQDTCSFPVSHIGGLTDAPGGAGFWYTDLGSESLGDGYIYETYEHTCQSPYGSLSPYARAFGDGPGGDIQDDIGALAHDPDTFQLWAAGYSAQGGMYNIYSVDTNGEVLDSCRIPVDGGPGNDSLTIAHISGLTNSDGAPGSGTYLLTDAGGTTTLRNKLYAFDRAECAGGASPRPIASFTKPVGMRGIDFAMNPNGNGGTLFATDGAKVYNLGNAPFQSIVSPTTTAPEGNASAITVSHATFKIRVAPVGDVHAGTIAPGVAGNNSGADFCPDNTLVFTHDGDIYAEQVTFTTPPTFDVPRKIWDADQNQPLATSITCTQSGKVVFQADGDSGGYFSTHDLFMIDLRGEDLQRITNTQNGYGEYPIHNYYAPVASRTIGDDRIAIEYSFGRELRAMDYQRVAANGGTSEIQGDSELIVEGVGEAAWGDDGRITYTQGFQDNPNLMTINSDGSDPKEILDYTWSARGLSAAGSLIAFAGGPSEDLGIHIIDLAEHSTQINVIGADPEEMTADVVYQCANGGPFEPVAVGVTPYTALYGNHAYFAINNDLSNACGDGVEPGTLRVIVSNRLQIDTFDIVASGEADPPTSPKPPVASIDSPRIGARFGPHSMIPLNGFGIDPENGELGPPIESEDADLLATGKGSILWWMDGGAPGSLGTDRQIDAVPPPGGWTPGAHTIHLRATDVDGNFVDADRSITIADDVKPIVTIEGDDAWRATDATLAIHAVDPDSGLGGFGCTADGNNLAITPAFVPGSFTYDGTVTLTTSGAHTLSCTAGDGAGNAGNATTTISIDKVAPSISLPAPANGWSKTSPLPVHIGASDGTSGLGTIACTVDDGEVPIAPTLAAGTPTYSGSVDATGDGDHSIVCLATDVAGNSSSDATTVRVDATPPTLQITPSAGPNGWAISSPATVSVHAADAMSKLSKITCKADGAPVTLSADLTPEVSTYDASFTVAGEGVHPLSCTVNDLANNNTTLNGTSRIDLTPPAITLSPPNPGTWNKSSPINVHINATDSASGIASILCKVDGTATPVVPAVNPGVLSYGGNVPVSGDGEHTIGCAVNDVSGRATGDSVTALIDMFDPALSVSPPPTSAGWVTQAPAYVAIAASDGGSKLSKIACKTDGVATTIAPDVPASAPSYNGTVDVTGEGSHTVSCTATDVAGNNTTQAAPVKIDSTIPSLSLSVPANANGWNKSSPVLVGVSASDTGSKLATIACAIDGVDAVLHPDFHPGAANYSGTVTVTGEGAHPVSCVSIDAAGNQRGAAASANIDLVAPTIVVTRPAPGDVFTLRQIAPADFACADNVSGIESCAGSSANGAPIDTTTVGTHSFRVDATDHAKNGAVPVIVTYRVAYDFGWSAPTKPPSGVNAPAVLGTTTVAWRLLDASGAPITDPAAITGITWRPEPLGLVGTWSLGLLEQPATGTLRVSGDHFVYDWSAPPLPLPMVLSIKVNDGSKPHEAYFSVLP